MKILMIAPQPFFTPRGTPFSVYYRTRILTELGHKVDLLTYPLGRDVHIPGLKIIRTISVPFIKNIKIGPSIKKLVLDFILFWKAAAVLRKANSAYFAADHKIMDVGKAIVRIGFNETQKMLIGMSVVKLFNSFSPSTLRGVAPKRRMLRHGPPITSGGMMALTREPSASRASSMGELSSICRPMRAATR